MNLKIAVKPVVCVVFASLCLCMCSKWLFVAMFKTVYDHDSYDAYVCVLFLFG